MLKPLLIAAVLAFAPLAQASACMTSRPFNFRLFGRADIVLNARIIGYETKSFAHFYGNGPGVLGVLEFEAVDRAAAPSATKHGANLLYPTGIRGKFKAYLGGGAGKAPVTWTGPEQVIVALTVYPLPDGTPGMFIAPGLCSGPSVVEDNVENMLRIVQEQDHVRNWLYALPEH